MSLNKTTIEWVKNPDGSQGYTWNPITGCLNGCEYCYARKLANGRLKSRYLAIKYTSDYDPYHPRRCEHLDDPFYPRFWEDRLDDIKPSGAWWDTLGGRRAKGIFVCNMGELFGDWIPREWQEQIFDTIKSDPLDRFYLLTKQPQNLPQFSPFPDHCYVGVTATNAEKLIVACEYLADVKAKIKYLSIEPFLSWRFIVALSTMLHRYGINWVIIGACTGTELEMRALLAHQTSREVGYVLPYGNKWTLQPKIEWVEEIVRACDKAGIPVFLKKNLGHNLQYGKNLSLTHRPDEHGVLVLRQELPNE